MKGRSDEQLTLEDTYAIPQALYHSEINSASNASSTAVGSSGSVTRFNGWDEEMRVAPPLKFEHALERLKLLALEHYPDSDFAKRFAEDAGGVYATPPATQ